MATESNLFKELTKHAELHEIGCGEVIYCVSTSLLSKDVQDRSRLIPYLG